MKLLRPAGRFLVLPLALLLTGAASASEPSRPGVTVLTGHNYRGAAETFYEDVPDLAATSIGDNRGNSVRVDPGCRVELFRDAQFGGQSIELRRDQNSLGPTPVGANALSSMRISCRLPEPRPEDRKEVVFFSEPGYRGRSLATRADVTSFRNTPVADQGVGSMRIGRGCVVVLHSEENHGGAALALKQSVADTVADGLMAFESVSVSCLDGVLTLYSETSFGGESASFDHFVRDLATTPFGAQRARSARVASGCWAVLYREPDFRGAQHSLTGAVADLSKTMLLRGSVSSIKVECR